MQARFVQQNFDGRFRANMLALPKRFSYATPLFFIGTPSEKFLSIIGSHPLTKHLHSDGGLPVTRTPSGSSMGVVYHDERVATLRVFYKPNYDLKKVWFDAVIAVLRAHGIETMPKATKQRTNDIVFVDSKKKFAGCFNDKKLGFLTSIITFDFAPEAAALFKDPKPVEGLKTHNAALGAAVIEEIARAMADTMGYALAPSNFTDSELALIRAQK